MTKNHTGNYKRNYTREVPFKKARSLLLKGEVVAIPTETVYGLAGRVDRAKSIEKIFQIKQRPLFDPLIVHCHSWRQISEYIAEEDLGAQILFKHFSPGPLTLVLKKNKKISDLITAGKPTAGFRIPKHPLTQKLLFSLPVPLAAPSANVYGQLSPVRAADVCKNFKRKVPVLNGGACDRGIESTIVRIDDSSKKIFILRPGMITKEDLSSFVKAKRWDCSIVEERDACQPGGQKSHYRPSVPLYILKSPVGKEEALRLLSKKFPTKKLKQLKLDPSPYTTARFLYSRLSELSKDKANIIFVIRTKELEARQRAKQGGEQGLRQEEGLWHSIWDRLSKAASGTL